MRIATYNVEWFASLFDAENKLLWDDGWSGRRDVTRAAQIEALGVVFAALDADAILVVEAPDTHGTRATTAALEHFSARFGLRARRAVIGFANDTQQEIALLYDPDKMDVQHDPQDVGAPRFDGEFRIDLDIDAQEDVVRFSKPPLELTVTTQAGNTLRMIGAHLKSKAPHGAKNRDEEMQIAIANRRKNLAQAIWLRRRVDKHLHAGEALMVLGDLNDGPGLDVYEHLFGRSSVEIVLGAPGPLALFDPHAQQALSQRLPAIPTTARFYQRREARYLQVLLDYIMVSADLRARGPRWRIWHPLDDPQCWSVPELRDALLTASDHFPVTVDLEI